MHLFNGLNKGKKVKFAFKSVLVNITGTLFFVQFNRGLIFIGL